MSIGAKVNVVFFIVVSLFIGLAISYLFFLKPTTKYSYIFQRYILKRDPLSLEFWPPKTGIYKTWYRNGQISEVGEYKDGLSEGLFVEYYEDGKIRSIKQYEKGKKNGEYIVYINNQIYDKKRYLNGVVTNIYILNGRNLDKEQERIAIEEEKAGIISP